MFLDLEASSMGGVTPESLPSDLKELVERVADVLLDPAFVAPQAGMRF